MTTPYDKGQNDIKKVKDNSRTLNIREAVLYQQPTDAKALYVEIFINSNTFLAVVDSAGQVSVLNKSLLHQLGPTIKLKQDINLKGAGRGSRIEARYTGNLDVKLGSLKAKWKLVVADISDDIILDIDVLEHFHAIIDLANYSIRINQESIPALCLKNRYGSSSTVYRVSIGRRVIVPPNSMKVAKVQLDKNPDQDLAVQPGYNLKGLPTPNLLLKQSTGMQTILRNSTNNYTENWT